MIVTKIAVAMGVVLLGIACWMAAIGVTAASEGLLTVLALVLLVAGGNYMAGRTSGVRRGPPPAGGGRPGPHHPGEGAPVADAGAPARPDAAAGEP